jgi:hypothetical protein
VLAAFLYLATMFGREAEEGGLGFLVPIYVSRAQGDGGGSDQGRDSLFREASDSVT